MSMGPFQRPLFMRDWNYREPSSEELEELVEWVQREMGFDREEAENTIIPIRKYIGIIDPYTPDSPGWVGKMAFIVFGGSHRTFAVVRWTDGEVETVHVNPI